MVLLLITEKNIFNTAKKWNKGITTDYPLATIKRERLKRGN